MSWGRNPARARPVPMAGWWRCEQVHGVRLSPGRVLCKERRRCWPFVRMAGSLSGEGLHPRVCPCQGRLGRRETAGSRCGREQVRQSSSRTALPPQPPRCPRSRGASQGAAQAALSCWLPSEKAERALTRLTEQSGKDERNAVPIQPFASSPGSPRTLPHDARTFTQSPHPAARTQVL